MEFGNCVLLNYCFLLLGNVVGGIEFNSLIEIITALLKSPKKNPATSIKSLVLKAKNINDISGTE